MTHPPPWIAIVDDDAGVRAALTSLVRSLGYEARPFPSALAFLEIRGGDPAVLIADIQMPGMTGDALQARLNAEGRRFPILFMTAFAAEAVRARVLTAGAAGCLDKPVDGETIARCLAAALARPGA
jgi:FixJ family two-component response regulator